jgi:predicted nucleic acid-binding protein
LTRYLLDTNVISNITKPDASESLLEWVGVQSDGDLFISSLTVAEIRRGILDKPKGKKRERLEAWFAGPEGPQSLFKGRILPFDEKAALVWARLMSEGRAAGSEGRAAGKPRSDLDMIVAAVAESNECVIVTDNEKHFSGLDVLNPLRTSR